MHVNGLAPLDKHSAQSIPTRQQTTPHNSPQHTLLRTDTHTGQNYNAATPHTATLSSQDNAADVPQSPWLVAVLPSSRFGRRTSLSGESGGGDSSGGVGREIAGEKKKKRKKKKSRSKNKGTKGVE